MTFDPSQPIATQSPGLFPTANHTNMSRISSQIGIDHQYNNTAAANDGWHKVIHWSQQPAIDPLTPGTAAPATGASEVVSWEAPDTYGVARPWFRSPSNGNVSSMMGWTELKGTQALTQVPVSVVTPPPNTIGTIILFRTAGGVASIAEGIWVNDGGVFTMNGVTTKFASSGAVVQVYIGNMSLDRTTIWAATSAATFDGVYTWRCYYRYL